MKVIAFNGSPNKEGNTYHGIKLVTDELEKEGIETEIIHVGNKSIRGCIACGLLHKKIKMVNVPLLPIQLTSGLKK